MTRARLLFACLLLTGCAASKPPADADETYGVLELRADAEDLRAMVNEPWILRFLAATEQLSPVPPRTLMVDAERKAAYTRKEAAELPAAEQAGLRKETFDDTYYFTTRFGTPLAYVRPFQVLAGAGLADVKGKKVLDFGHGMITQLQLLARIGADVVGMSTIPELIAARHIGLATAAISCVTNYAAGIGTTQLNHEEVTRIAEQARPGFTALLGAVFQGLAGSLEH